MTKEYPLMWFKYAVAALICVSPLVNASDKAPSVAPVAAFESLIDSGIFTSSIEGFSAAKTHDSQRWHKGRFESAWQHGEVLITKMSLDEGWKASEKLVQFSDSASKVGLRTYFDPYRHRNGLYLRSAKSAFHMIQREYAVLVSALEEKIQDTHTNIGGTKQEIRERLLPLIKEFRKNASMINDDYSDDVFEGGKLMESYNDLMETFGEALGLEKALWKLPVKQPKYERNDDFEMPVIDLTT
jgi:hypothetical protein